MIMEYRSIFIHGIANDPKLRITAKVWKVLIKFPCGFCLKEDVVHFKTVKWAIYQVLN
jgi:hypothetical protein